MTPEALKLLEDMREAADDVAAFTSGKSVDDYRWDIVRSDLPVLRGELQQIIASA